jgi:acetoin utilization deacetylase AcuC-like enzyme
MSERPLCVWASDHYGFPLPGAHPFPLAKYTLVREALLADGTIAPTWVSRSEPAPSDWLVAAHDPDYVARTLAGDWTAAEVRRLGLPWSADLVTRARAAIPRHGDGRARRARARRRGQSRGRHASRVPGARRGVLPVQ